MSAERMSERGAAGGPPAVAVPPVPLSGVSDGRDRDSQDATVVAVCTPTCVEPIRHGVDDAAQPAPTLNVSVCLRR
jgi:hypothetical protein